MSVFVAALDSLFIDPSLARTATYRSGGLSDGVSVRVIAKRNDQISEFSDISIVSATARFDLRVSEVPEPLEGDTITLDGETFIIQGEPIRDTERLIWTVDTRPL
ncbi:head-tail joining protein [Thalassospira alkalitolerans]|uniref:head-tail joining protein n=1 Tax=Thalassospira alkalitolerans TaxID=1293890 RepID=UPI0030EE485C|tara:strand:+ start:29849 stop:30163 length:315 start_codon:yes stop_codon:yes gene_type:complete